MAKSFALRFKKPVKGYAEDEDPTFPAIGRAIQHLNKLATIQSWKTLSSFISEDPDAAMDLLDEEDEDEIDAIIKKLGKLRWSKGADVLKTVSIMAEAIEMIPRRLPLTEKNARKIVAELKELEKALQTAQAKKVPIRFFAEFG